MGRVGRSVLLVAVVVTLLTSCGEDGEGSGRAVYLGRIAFVTDLVAIALPEGRRDRAPVQIYVADGEPGGDAEWFEGVLAGDGFELFSRSGRSTIRGTLDAAGAQGTIELPRGAPRTFAAGRARDGAGIYDVVVTPEGRFVGTSTTGGLLEGRRQGGDVVGTLEGDDGRVAYRVTDLTRALDYGVPGDTPARYLVLVARNGASQFGRSDADAVRAGRPGQALLALELPATSRPTPGFYFGRVAFVTDVMGLQVDPPDASGRRRVRVYVSDSEPEPAGDVEWFEGVATDGAFDLVSASRGARIEGRISPELVHGSITLPDGVRRRYAARLAGDGAGIYDVTVTSDGRFRGLSREGSVLTGRQKGSSVRLLIETFDGQVVRMTMPDLTRVLGYAQLGNAPDTYVAFVGNRARYVFGRSGNVRGGSSGNNIIGLDNSC